MFLGILAPRTEVRGSIPGLDQQRKSAPCRARTAWFKADVSLGFSTVRSLELNSLPDCYGLVRAREGLDFRSCRDLGCCPGFQPGVPIVLVSWPIQAAVVWIRVSSSCSFASRTAAWYTAQ